MFSDADPYPSGGNRRVKYPIIPETFDVDGLPAEEIVAVPEGAEGLGDLALVADGEGTTVPAPAVDTAPTDDLDVPDRAAALLKLLREADVDEVTAREAEALADEHGDGLDVSYRTIKSWIDALADAGALQRGEYRQREGTVYRVR